MVKTVRGSPITPGPRFCYRPPRGRGAHCGKHGRCLAPTLAHGAAAPLAQRLSFASYAKGTSRKQTRHACLDRVRQIPSRPIALARTSSPASRPAAWPQTGQAPPYQKPAPGRLANPRDAVRNGFVAAVQAGCRRDQARRPPDRPRGKFLNSASNPPDHPAILRCNEWKVENRSLEDQERDGYLRERVASDPVRAPANVLTVSRRDRTRVENRVPSPGPRAAPRAPPTPQTTPKRRGPPARKTTTSQCL